MVFAGQVNQLLAALPSEESGRWLARAESVEMRRGKVIHEHGEVPSHVYFPTTAIVSILLETESGSSIEIAHVGFEGIVGVALFMGGGRSLWRAVVQSSGAAVRVPADVFKAGFEQNASIQHALLRYTHALISQMGQTAVCSRHHKIPQQLSRWLLHSLDRMAGVELEVTHDFISQMLGVRREGVTEAALQLQSLGLIKCSRGHISIVNRPGLEKAACECYSIIKREYDGLVHKN